MSRILWLGDAGCHTGFAKVTHNVAERLVTQYGHDVHVLAVNYDGDYYNGPLKLYRPNKNMPSDVYGQSRYLEMLGIVEPDVVFILNDPHIILKFLFLNTWDEEKILLRHCPIVTYMPVDGYNYPGAWHLLEDTTSAVVMSNHGKKAFPKADLVYHGVDTKMFRPLSTGEKVTSTGKIVRTAKDAKRAFGYDPDGFLVLRVDRNDLRKDFADTWKALVPVMKRHSDVQVHFHCTSRDEGADLRYLLTREPELEPRFFFPGGVNTFQGWPIEDISILYNAADMFVSTSMGEGFGLTLAEAAASGTPIVAQDCSSITEVVGPGGILVPPGRPFSVYNGTDMYLPDVEAFTDAIEHLYSSRGARRDLGEKGRDHVVANFNWDVATSQFNDIIANAVTEQLQLDAVAQQREGVKA
jgi:glycosyltransferase involved in cell wall biosynthesis